VTFYLDEDLSPRIAEMLRDRGVDAVSAHELPGNTQLDDRTQALYAAGTRRAIVTCDSGISRSGPESYRDES
jgi:predicted nuclease of predicted toxin-antitoxin system